MKKAKSIVTIFVWLVIGQAFAGLEAENALEQINNSVAFGLSGFNLDYKEIFLATDDPRAKSTEAGTILGYFFDIRRAFAEKIYTGLYLDYYDGRLKYDGSELYTYNPLSYKLGHRFFNAEARVGYVIPLFENHAFQVIPYIGGGYRYWYRGYNNLSGQEKYQNYKIVGGLKLNWLVTDHFTLSPYFEGGKTFSASMKYCGSGANSGNNYTLENKPIYEAGLEANWRVFDEFFLTSFVSYAQFKYGRSAIQYNNYLEPDSKTREIKVGLGVRYSWLID